MKSIPKSMHGDFDHNVGDSPGFRGQSGFMLKGILGKYFETF